MAVLIIYRGEAQIDLHPSNEVTYLYRIGSGNVIGRDCIDLNDSEALNRISLSIRDSYVQWIYSLNKSFVKKNLIEKGLSLFFLTDLSHKRNELFDTYETIATVCFLKEKLEGVALQRIELINLDKAFAETISSTFSSATIEIQQRRSSRIQLKRRLAADIKYMFEMLLIVIINKIFKKRFVNIFNVSKRSFFSFYPQMFQRPYVDDRYREFVTDDDTYLVTLVADGMHQQVSPLRYIRLLRSMPREKYLVVDVHLRCSDLIVGITWWFRMYRALLFRNDSVYFYGDLNVTNYIRQEIIWSISRVARLMVFAGGFERVIKQLKIDELIYIVFEYPLGRLISHLVGFCRPDILRTGFNHGDYSWRFINYFLAQGEASSSQSHVYHCPIPDKVLAEDSLCAEIYRYNGYRRVEQMERVYRLDYLENVEPKKDKRCILIAAGLHDGKALMNMLLTEITNSKNVVYLLKPHPRADNSYTKGLMNVPNLNVVASPIEELLSIVGEVYVTYSGVGIEALRLGIPVKVACIPGRILWSKLLDYKCLPENVDVNVYPNQGLVDVR